MFKPNTLKQLISANMSPEEKLEADCISKAMPPGAMTNREFVEAYFNVVSPAQLTMLLTQDTSILTMTADGKPLILSLPAGYVPSNFAESTSNETMVIAHRTTSTESLLMPVNLGINNLMNNYFGYVWAPDVAQSPLFKCRAIAAVTAADWVKDKPDKQPDDTDTTILPNIPDKEILDQGTIVTYVALLPSSILLPPGLALYDDSSFTKVGIQLTKCHTNLGYWWEGLRYTMTHLKGNALDNATFIHNPPNRIIMLWDSHEHKKTFPYIRKTATLELGQPNMSSTSTHMTALAARFGGKEHWH